MSYLKQSTTSTIKVGPILSATDLSALDSATLTVKLSKNGGTLAARHSETAIAHDADGNYTVELDATDSGTCGELTVAVTATGAIPWTKTYSVINELAYTELMGNKHDAAMLGEAIRQGYDPERDAIVLWADTDAGRGTNLKTAVAAVGDLTPTASKWGRVWIPPWHYKIETATLALNTNYVELKALFPEPGGRRLKTDIDYTDGTTSLGQFRPSRTLIYSDSANLPTVTQSAQYVRMNGFSIAYLSATNSTLSGALLVTANTNDGSTYDQMYFWHRSPNVLTGSAVYFRRDVAGTWNRCRANSVAWRLGYADNQGVFSASMWDCDAGVLSFIGDYLNIAYAANYYADNCDIRRCEVLGTYETTDEVVHTGKGFAGCEAFGVDIHSNCYFEDDKSHGPRSFGLGKKNEGTYLHCYGEEHCFASTTHEDFPGEFGGVIIDSYGKKGSIGGRMAGIGNYGKLTGTVINCVVDGGELPTRVEGATVVDTTFKMSTTNQSVLTILDSTSKIHNSTLLPVEGGTGVPIYAASALSVSAAGNTYGNKSAAANGLGSNVTNLATIDVVPKVDLTTAASSVTNAVTTDSASREASKADVSTLATSTELAASKTILDKFDSMIAEDS